MNLRARLRALLQRPPRHRHTWTYTGPTTTTTTTTTITVAQRWAANAVRVGFRRLERYEDATALEQAQQAEGFPHSYTPAAVELAQRVIAAAAEYRQDPEASGVLEDLLEDVRELQLSGGWYA